MIVHSQPNLRKTLIPSLGGLRAISILIVLAGHIFEAGYIKVNRNSPFFIFVDSGLGVNIFFVISGFLITSLLLDEEIKGKSVSLKKFYIRRMIRIFPAYYFVVLIYFLLDFCFKIYYFSATSWFTTLTFTKYLSPVFDWKSAHFWSLSVEEHFYLVFPLFFKFYKERTNFVLLLSIFIVCILRLLLFYGRLGFFNNEFAEYGVTIFQRGDAIAIGCLVALNYDRIMAYIVIFKKIIKYPVLIALILIFAYKSLFYIFHIHLGVVYKTLGIGATSTIANIFIAVILICSIEFTNTQWYKLLNSTCMNYVGTLSYSIYLWQQLFISYHPIFFFEKMPINFLFIILTALISYNLIEKPFLRLKDKFKVIHIKN